jgi:[acyl-carrier-protein] S-malonyltransferase
MAAILGLADEVVEGLCKRISNVWPANYNCPGQIVVSGEDDAVGECCTRRSAKAPVARSGCASPARSTRRSSSVRPTSFGRGREDPLRRSANGVHVDGDREARGRKPLSRAARRQLTAPVKFTQAARELVGKGVTVFVEVGPGNVLSGLLKRIDRSVRTVSVSDMNGLRELEETLA